MQGPAVALRGLGGEIEAHPHVALLGPAGIAGVEGLLPSGQALSGKAGAGVLHGDGQRLAVRGYGQGDGAAGGRVARRIVQQIAHCPVQVPPVDRQLQPGHLRAAERRRLCPAEALAHLPPALGQRREGNPLLLPAEGGLGAGHGPQLGHIVLEAEGAAENGVHTLPLALGQGVLPQQLRVAADDAEGGLEVVGQGRQLQPALLLHAPLALQGLRQVPPQVIHGL